MTDFIAIGLHVNFPWFFDRTEIQRQSSHREHRLHIFGGDQRYGSRMRVAAGASGFLILTPSGDRPER